MTRWWSFAFLGLASCGGLLGSDPASEEAPPAVRPLDPSEEAMLLVADNDNGRPRIVRVSATAAKVEELGPPLDSVGPGRSMVRRVWTNDAATRVVVLLEQIVKVNPLQIEAALVAGEGGAWRTLARGDNRLLNGATAVSPGLDLVWAGSMLPIEGKTVFPCEAKLMDFSGATLFHLPDEQCGGPEGLRLLAFPRTGRWAAYANDGVVAFAGPDAANTAEVPIRALGLYNRSSPLGSSSVVTQNGDALQLIGADGTVRERPELGILHPATGFVGRSASHGPYVKRDNQLYRLHDDGAEELAVPALGVEGVVSGSPRRVLVSRYIGNYDLVALRPEGVEAVLDTSLFDDDVHRTARAGSMLNQYVDVTSVVDTESRTTAVAIIRHDHREKQSGSRRIDEHLVAWTVGTDGQFVTRELVRFSGGEMSFWPALDNHGVAISTSGRFVTYADPRGAHLLDLESMTDTPLSTRYRLHLGPQVTVR